MAQQQTKEKFKTMIGGQALIEGIMMRGPEKDAVAVRTKDGIQLDEGIPSSSWMKAFLLIRRILPTR